MSQPSAALQRRHARWLRAIDRCLEVADRPDVCAARAPGVSGWSVGQQLEHLMLADGRTLDSVDRLLKAAASGGETTTGSPTLLGRLILATGFIPRGRAKAPESTTPTGLDPAALLEGLQRNRDRVAALGGRLGEVQGVDHTSQHPILGRFTPSRWVQFSGVHHAHHAKIVRDIRRAAGA